MSDISTHCMYCRPYMTQTARAQIERLERLWEETPVKVSERKCSGCKATRHWWYYLRESDLGFTATRWSDEHEALGLNTPIGRITQAMLNEFRNNPERLESDRVIILYSREGLAGIRSYGYDGDADLAAYLFSHLRAIFQENGQDLQVHQLPGGNPLDN